MFNVNELNRVENANPRTREIGYDIAYSFDTEKFRVSPSFYDQIDANNNGLTLYEDKANDRLILATEPNETAVMYKGREGSTKGREFTSSRMRTLLNRYGFDGVEEFTMEKAHEEGQSKYFLFNSKDENAGQSSNDTSVGSPPADNDEGDSFSMDTDDSVENFADNIL